MGLEKVVAMAEVTAMDVNHVVIVTNNISQMHAMEIHVIFKKNYIF